jgi:hypothetical protein
MALGGWRTQETTLGIRYHQSVTILGITFWGTIAQTTNDTWARITGKVRVQAKKTYVHDPSRTLRIKYVNTCLLCRLWYEAQILSVTHTYIHRNWRELWRGAYGRKRSLCYRHRPYYALNATEL